MSSPFYPLNSFPLKFLKKRMNFLFSLLKLLNKRMEEYSKIILPVPFHSILFISHIPNEG